MKRKSILTATFLLFLAFLVNGCTPANFQEFSSPAALSGKIRIITPKDKSDKRVWFENQNRIEGEKDTIRKVAETFYAAALYGKRRGYRYFALTNDNINNLGGFPVNSLNNIIGMLRFELADAKRYYKPRQLLNQHHKRRGIFAGHRVYLQVRYFKRPIPGTFLFHIDETIRQAKRYMK